MKQATIMFLIRSRVSSVSMVSGYGLYKRTNEVLSPAEERGFSSNLCVQTATGTHTASCLMGTGGPFNGVKRDRSWRWSLTPFSAEVLNE
jgi:hypothetical protein